MVRFSDLAWLYDAEKVVLHFDVFSKNHEKIPFNKSFPHRYHYKEKDELTFKAQIVRIDGSKRFKMIPLDVDDLTLYASTYVVPKWLMGAQVIKAHPVHGKVYASWLVDDDTDEDYPIYVNLTLLVK